MNTRRANHGPAAGAGLLGLIGLAVGVCLLGLIAWIAIRGPQEEPVTLTLEERYQEDDRVGPLFYDCHFGRPFTEPTVDMIEVLVSKLEMGTRDPLLISKRELSQIGEPAVPALRRLFDRAYQDRWKHGVVENVLAVCTMMEEPWGLDMLRFALGHPQESVRQAALRGIELHGSAKDYDLVSGWLPMVANSNLRVSYVLCMGALDPERFSRDIADWLASGLQADLYPRVIGGVLAARDPETVARLKALYEERDDVWAVFLLGPAARDGDQEALDAVHKTLHSEEPALRQNAIQTLSAIDRALDTALLFNDPHVGIRSAVAAALVGAPPSEEVNVWLREGIGDQDPGVSETCLAALVKRGDEWATAHCLALLEGNILERSMAIRSLREAWEGNEELVEDATNRLERLVLESDLSAGLPIERIQTLAQVRGERAAHFLMDLAMKSEGRIKGLPAFRWLVGQVWNTGPAGHRLLRERLLVETDPFRRLSLIEFVWQDHSQESLDLLLEILDDDTRHPMERLYAADRCAHLGPAARVASILKRVYLRSSDIKVRPAMQCLLWTWYGQHYEISR